MCDIPAIVKVPNVTAHNRNLVLLNQVFERAQGRFWQVPA